MTWGEVKLAALQRIFSNDGAALNRDDSNEEYLNAMPAVANEALSIITGVGIPLLKKLTVEVSEAVTEPEQDGQTLRIPLTENGVARIDMREAAADYRALESGELYWETARDGYGPAGSWSVEGCDTLVLGCTHYPLLWDVIGAFMGPEVTLVNSGKEAACQLAETLKRADMLS